MITEHPREDKKKGDTFTSTLLFRATAKTSPQTIGL
jgi:hypothetical protein